MNILFATYGDFHSNSALHIFNIANRLQLSGHRCVVAVPGDPETVCSIGTPLFRPASMKQWHGDEADTGMDGRVDLVVAWTPREVVRRFVEAVCHTTKAPYVVHLEDNEDALAAAHVGVTLEQVLAVPRDFWDTRTREGVSHPYRMREFLRNAAGITVLSEALLQFVPDGVRSHVFWPGWNEQSFSEQPNHEGPTREECGLPPDACIVVYHGNSHTANAADMRSLYAAIAIARRAGTPAQLIRIGCDYIDFLGALADVVSPYVKVVGYLPNHRMIPGYLALADVCVQPGKADAFNEYRFPSKIPEFMIAGKPLVMAKTNIGKVLQHKTNAWIMEHGDSIEIAKALRELHADPPLRKLLGENARDWARSHLSWRIALEGLEPFYSSCSQRTSRGSRGPSGAVPHADTKGHAMTDNQPADQIHWVNDDRSLSYATVRDWVDSLGRYPDLATKNKDLKDVQRPWVLKTISEHVPRGARLLEIGGGDPWVADLLSKQGYDVSIIDPYDGRDNGPSNVDHFRRSYPRIRFIEGLFPMAIDVQRSGHFDAIYSISVLEHVPAGEIRKVGEGINRFLKSGGVSVHAVDHVLLGNGDAQHLSNLRQWCHALVGDDSRLTRAMAALERDADTYFLSAESHNMWRGSIPYDDFPMRRCVSMHFSNRKG